MYGSIIAYWAPAIGGTLYGYWHLPYFVVLLTTCILLAIELWTFRAGFAHARHVARYGIAPDASALSERQVHVREAFLIVILPFARILAIQSVTYLLAIWLLG